MQRNIDNIGLCRGKRKDNHEWIEGFLFIGFEKAYICPSPTAAYVFDGALCLGGFIEVDTDTVSRFSGFCDKFGRKIFEGDIVCCDPREKRNGIIRFRDDKYQKVYQHDVEGFFIDWAQKHYRGDLRYWHLAKDIQIIGNVWDDPGFVLDMT